MAADWAVPADPPLDDSCRPLGGDQLASGIWPRAPVIWMVALYMALFVIRPWERLVPQLAPLHFERVFALVMITVLVFSGRPTRPARLKSPRACSPAHQAEHVPS